jgi:predicted Zn-dependent protease
MPTTHTSSLNTGEASLDASDRFLTYSAVQALLDRVVKLGTGGGSTDMWIRSRATGNIRWARNRITTAGDTTDHEIWITRIVRGARGDAITNRTDDDSLRFCIQRAEAAAGREETSEYRLKSRRSERYDVANLWSDETANLNAERRAEVQQELVGSAISSQLLSAGYIEVSAGGNGYINTEGLFAYAPVTRAEYSVTVRNPKGTGSGWAGMDHLNWRNIDAKTISQRALEKCQQSIDPVAIEPGRYTTVLEPQAVAELVRPMIASFTDRVNAENGMGPWARPLASGRSRFLDHQQMRAKGDDRPLTKISMKVLDERVTIRTDPVDPEMPLIPFWWDGGPIRATKWIDAGVLRSLQYNRGYALEKLNRPDPLYNTQAFRMDGGTMPIPEMIANVRRGLLVTRFVNVRVIHDVSLLCTGQTSDGLWLIENGKVTKAVKNFRFRESPLFAFNNLIALGEPVRVLNPKVPAMVPPALVRDFSMNSLSDAV